MAVDREERVARALDRILQTIPSEHNREVVRRYLDERAANGIKGGTRLNDANALRAFCESLEETRLEDVERRHVVDWLNVSSRARLWRSRTADDGETITRRQVRLGPRVLSIRRVIVRQFFRWLRGTEDYPPEVRFLRPMKPAARTMPTDSLLTAEEIQAMIRVQPDAQGQALIAVLYESGLRAGEFCAVNVASVQFHEKYASLTLPKNAPGLKTGPRQVLLFESVPYLQRFLELHPRKTQPTASLFYGQSRRAPGARLVPAGLYQICRRAGEQARLPKRVHPHLFRHTAATERARQGWTEAQMRAMFGWAKDSDVPSLYVHLAGKDYQEMELERRGLLDPATRSRTALAPRTCRACHAPNTPTALFCESCRSPMAPEAVAELETRRHAEVLDAVRTIMSEMSASFAPGLLVFPPQEPIRGVTGADLERRWLESRSAHGRPMPRRFVVKARPPEEPRKAP